MEKIAKFGLMLGITSMVAGTFGFLLPNNSIFQFMLLVGILISIPSWSFSSQVYRDRVKIFLSEHWFGRYVGYVLITLAVICILMALFNQGDPNGY